MARTRGLSLSRARRRHAARLAALIATVLLASCGGKRDDVASDTGTDVDKRHAAEYLRAFLIERDWQRWPEYFTPDAKLNGSDMALQIMRGTSEGLNFSLADLTLTIREQVAEPHRVATAFVLAGRHEREFNDQPPTHQRLEIDGYAFDRFEGGKVAESSLFIDVGSFSRRNSPSTRTK
jgi:predicted ester cyclase